MAPDYGVPIYKAKSCVIILSALKRCIEGMGVIDYFFTMEELAELKKRNWSP
jgi:hypothetical protein